MKRAALGIQMHSGWGVLVAIAGGAGSLEVVDRRRIIVADPRTVGARQPYHHAASLELTESERHIATCAAASERLAVAAISEVVRELAERGHHVAGSAVLLASGRPLPSLPRTLASHALIHTAEGALFRDAARRACEQLDISVVAIRERELEERAKTTFGRAASGVQRTIAALGRTIGPPWTKDHKTAALAATMVLEHQAEVEHA